MRLTPLLALIALSWGCEPSGQITRPGDQRADPPKLKSKALSQAQEAARDKDKPLPPVKAEEAPPASARLAEASDLRDKIEAHFKRNVQRRLHVQTDKPLYRPGETIWVRGWDLKASNLQGHDPGYSVALRAQLINPKGAVVLDAPLKAKLGQAEGAFDLPAAALGGVYKLRITAFDGLKEEREIVVSAYEPPRIKKKIDFVRKAYGAGDTVGATLEIRRPTGEPLANHPLSAMIRLDGVDLPKVNLSTNARGDALVEVKLPDQIQLGDGLLTVLIKDGGVTESISRRVPIVMRKVQLSFFPEGGPLVEGLESRVYFEAKNIFGKPADVEGVIIDDHGQKVARFRTHHQGLGRMSFTPNSGRTYHAQITRPAGITERYALPLPNNSGCVLRSYDDLDGALKPARVGVRCVEPQTLYLVATQREAVVDVATVEVKDGAQAVAYLDDKHYRMGVTRVTALSKALKPLAERVIFRHRRAQLQIKVTPDQDRYSPRSPVGLQIETKTPEGVPVAADLALAVVDDTALSFADDKTGHILSALLLEPEVPGKVEEPNFYFDLTEEKSALALDLLMGARGWRTFDWTPVFNPPRPIEVAASMGFVEGRGFGDLRDNRRIARRAPKRKKGGAKVGRKMAKRRARRPSPPKAAPVGRAAPEVMDMLDAAEAEASPEPEAPMAAAQPAKRPKAKPRKPPRDLGFNKRNEGKKKEQPAREKRMEPDEAPMGGDRAMPKEEEAAERGPMRVMAENQGVMAAVMADDEDAFRRKNVVGGLLKDAKEQDKAKIAGPVFAPVRVFKLPVYKPEYSGPRVDFRETIFWAPAVRTDEKGLASVTFPTSDAITSFRVTVEGAGARYVGHQEAVFKSSLPFSMNAKLPLAVSEGDLIELPVTLTNEVERALPFKINTHFADGLRLQEGPKRAPESLNPKQRESLYYGLKVDAQRGDLKITVDAEAGGLKDKFTRTLSVEPLGFPQKIDASGTLVTEETRKLLVADPLGGTLDAEIRFYASPTGTLLGGVEGLIREPHGCFEQTSATHYPNVMVMQYLATQKERDPQLVKRINGLLDRGYKRLVSFETKKKGYEWFGRAPGHEALTAYGLLEFSDMRGIYAVDEAMMKRTVAWLKKREDGKGGFKRNSNALDSFGRASADTTDAYVRWAIAEAGLGAEFTKAMDAQVKLASSTQDPYLLALAANTLNRLPSHRALGKEAAARLLKLQGKDGAWDKARESITRSGGSNLKIETTALAMLALMGAEIGHAEVQAAVKWLRERRSGFGQWGATQATVLALKAMTVYNIKMSTTQKAGAVTLLVNGTEVSTQRYEAGAKEPVHFQGFGKYLKAGENTITLKHSHDGPLPYSLAVTYRSLKPASAEDGAVEIATALEREGVKMGETVRLWATVTNRTQRDQPMTLVRVGLPGGLSFQNWQLKDLKERKQIAFFETKPREVILYLDGLRAGEIKKIPLDLEARVPGVYTGPASSGYLYYTNDKRRWAPGLKVKIDRG